MKTSTIMCMYIVWLLSSLLAGQEVTNTRVLEFDSRISNLNLSNDGKSIAFIKGHRTGLTIVDADTGEVTYEPGDIFPPATATTLQFTPDDEHLLAIANRRMLVKVMTLSEDRLTVEEESEFAIEQQLSTINGFASKEPLLASITNRQEFTVYNYLTGEQGKKIDISDFQPSSTVDIQLSARGGNALIMKHDSVIVVDIEKGEVVQSLKHNERLWRGEINRGGTKVVSTENRILWVLELKTGEMRKHRLNGNGAKVKFVDATNEFYILDDGVFSIRNGDSLKQTFQLELESDKADPWISIHVSQDGSKVIFQSKKWFPKSRIMVLDLDLDTEEE